MKQKFELKTNSNWFYALMLTTIWDFISNQIQNTAMNYNFYVEAIIKLVIIIVLVKSLKHYERLNLKSSIINDILMIRFKNQIDIAFQDKDFKEKLFYNTLKNEKIEVEEYLSKKHSKIPRNEINNILNELYPEIK